VLIQLVKGPVALPSLQSGRVEGLRAYQLPFLGGTPKKEEAASSIREGGFFKSPGSFFTRPVELCMEIACIGARKIVVSVADGNGQKIHPVLS